MLKISFYSQLFCWLLVSSLFLSFPLKAERYFTWVDEQGHLQQTLIPDEDKETIEETISTTATIENPVEIKPNESASKATISSEFPISLPLSPLKKSSQKLTKPKVKKTFKRSGYEIKESDYVDGEALEKRGFLRDPKRPPSYVWRDYEGFLHSAPYRPTSVEAKVNQTQYDNAGYSLATESRPTLISSLPNAQQSKMDDFAKKLFFDSSAVKIEDNIFNTCCKQIAKNRVTPLNLGTSLGLDFNYDSNSYRFIDGNSAFSLVKLPSKNMPYPLKVTSYTKKNRKNKEAVFYPRLLFLNRYFEAIRMVNDPVLEYQGESWSSQASLSGLFRVNPQQGEQYLLIYSSRRDKVTQSTIESEYDDEPAIKVVHSRYGLIELNVDE